jgi:hypothetical protein
VSVADSILVIVILSLVLWPFLAGLGPISQNRLGAPHPVVTPVTTAAWREPEPPLFSDP